MVVHKRNHAVMFSTMHVSNFSTYMSAFVCICLHFKKMGNKNKTMCATIEQHTVNVHGIVVELRVNTIDLLKVPENFFNFLASKTHKNTHVSMQNTLLND